MLLTLSAINAELFKIVFVDLDRQYDSVNLDFGTFRPALFLMFIGVVLDSCYQNRISLVCGIDIGWLKAGSPRACGSSALRIIFPFLHAGQASKSTPK